MSGSPPRPEGHPGSRPELVILVGLPASGKTTFYRRRFAATHAHVSRDVLGRGRDPKGRQRALVTEALGAGRSVVVDNTNARAAERAELIALGRGAGARVVGYHVESTPREAIARNRQREGSARVPPAAIHAIAKRLEPPRYAEGFDALYRVRIADADFEVAPAPPDAG